MGASAGFCIRLVALGLLVALGGLLTGCAPPTTDAGCEEIDWSESPRDEVGAARAALTLEALAVGGGCSTAGAEALSAQLIDEMLCLSAGRLVRFEHANVTLTSTRVHPYLSPEGRDALYVAAGSGEILINSALRTISDQYLLYAGCSVAATPGTSNHESGRALDVDNWSARESALVAAGFTHPLPTTDAVHFEAAGDDLRSLSVLAFQRLWNANHPTDTIADDGVSGPQTLARLAVAPAEGFAIAGVCAAPVEPSDAGVTTPDAGAPLDDAGVVPADDLGAPLDASPGDGRLHTALSTGCGCSAVGASGRAAGGGALMALAALLAARLVRRRRGAVR
jgi:MYXO-CTERM domain-containing protein